jgi:hypothetical protein
MSADLPLAKLALESNKKQDDYDFASQSLAPSHILQDGTFVNLPLASERERTLFFERSIARHGLLEEDLGNKKTAEPEEKKVPKIHPLALASAKLQSEGINELNRAINLQTLVATNEYFGMSFIVDPSHDVPAVDKTKTTTTTTTTTTSSTTALVDTDEARTRARHVLKRKRAQFAQSAVALDRHLQRLRRAIVAQAQPDNRLRHLRSQWRLVAPEHGSRALAHAARPTEVVACDVDLYAKERISLGRLARRIPRYATIELKTNYVAQDDLNENQNKMNVKVDDGDADELDAEKDLAVKTPTMVRATNEIVTEAEPFALADPALGKLDADFDPKNVSMLSLQFDIEKTSTGFCQSARLEPIAMVDVSSESGVDQSDEKVFAALQHSLLCATLFESIRRELAPDTEDVGNSRTTKSSSVVWLSSESETNFLPPSSLMSGDHFGSHVQLCVVHCHEGGVKVQLDSEYTLQVKLVEAGDTSITSDSSSAHSGSQPPKQLLLLCRTLLLHAQERYHQHSIDATDKLREVTKESTLRRTQTKEIVTSPCILQHCVSLGSKILFERRIRATIQKVNAWLKSTTSNANESLRVEWLSLSIFDLHSYLTITFRSWLADVHMVCDELCVTRVNDNGDYSKVKFYSDSEFELYLRLALQRVMTTSLDEVI